MEIEFLKAQQLNQRPQTAQTTRNPNEHLQEIEDLEIQNLFMGVGNRITHETISGLTGKPTEEFDSVKKIKLKKDLTLNNLQELGLILPHLQVLKLNGSNIHSLRDIGTSLKCLEVLNISRCNLKEFSGLVCFPKLQEIYASFNSISDLRPISDAHSLTILDIEGNDISEIKQLNNLDYSHQLKNLNIENNKVNSNIT